MLLRLNLGDSDNRSLSVCIGPLVYVSNHMQKFTHSLKNAKAYYHYSPNEKKTHEIRRHLPET